MGRKANISFGNEIVDSGLDYCLDEMMDDYLQDNEGNNFLNLGIYITKWIFQRKIWAYILLNEIVKEKVEYIDYFYTLLHISIYLDDTEDVVDERENRSSSEWLIPFFTQLFCALYVLLINT